MLNLALIDDEETASCYGRIANRMRGFRYTAVVARDTRVARMRAGAVGAEIWADTLEGLLTGHSSAFDGLVLAPRNACSEQCIRLAAAAGKHIFADSLWALPPNSVAALAAACRATNARLMVGNPSRFSPAATTIKARLDSKKLGEPGLLRIHRWTSIDAFQRGFFRGTTLAEWLEPEIDLACWLFADRPNASYAIGRGSNSLPDYVLVHLGFADGGMALIDLTRALPQGDGYQSLTLIGSAGAAYFDDHSNVQLLLTGGRTSTLISQEGDLAALNQISEFALAIQEARDPLCSCVDALRALEVAKSVASSLVHSDTAKRVERSAP